MFNVGDRVRVLVDRPCGARLSEGELCQVTYVDDDGDYAVVSDTDIDREVWWVSEAQIELVTAPNHYARWKMQPIEFIAANDLPFWIANIIKYICRYDAKNGIEDLRKARHYLDMKIKQLEGAERFWE